MPALHSTKIAGDDPAGPSTPTPGPSVARRKRIRQRIDEDAADLLAHVWEKALVDPHAYVQLVVSCIHHGSRRSSVPEIESFVPDGALDDLPPLTRVPNVPSVLCIEQHSSRSADGKWSSDGTDAILGPVAVQLAEMGDGEPKPRSVADAAKHLVETGDVTEVEALFPSAQANSTNPQQATPPETTHANNHAPPPPTPTHRPTPTTRRGRERPGHARRGRQGRARNEPLVGNRWGFFVGPPMSRLSAYRGRFRPDIEGIVGSTRRGILDTRRGIPGRESRDRRTLADIPVAREEELLRREPLGWIPDKPIPTKLYQDIVRWRPILEEATPLMAITQLILTSSKRDDNAAQERSCAGMPIACELVCGAFGYKPKRAWDIGLNAGIFLELWQKYVDSDLTWSDWASEEGRARVVLNHSIPQHIIDAAYEFMLSPEEQPDRTFMLSGTKANSRDALGPEREKRKRLVEENEPVVEPPETTLMMKEYLNGLDTVNVFTHGQHGVFANGKLGAMAEVIEEIPDEQRRIQELRKLFGLRTFPKPLYAACDRSPRLRADRWNQLMNVKTPVRKSLYVEGKDWELDLSKAHLASYVPTVRGHGIDTPQLDRYLQANLEDDTDLLARGDLWMELAHACDTEELRDLEALRDAVKRLYSVPYGMEWSRVLHNIAADYAANGGVYPDSHEPLRPLGSHPLVEELLETREELRAIINDRGGLKDASGRFIPLSKWDETKDKENRWRGLMSYVNAAYETEIVGAAFEEARKEKEREARTRFKIWLYQGDGFTIRVSSKASPERQIQRLKDAVTEKAGKLGVPTRLEIDWPE